MAKTKYRTSDLVRGELVIRIRPRGVAEYYGTRQQLIDEGLIPSGTTWPTKRDANTSWSAGEFEFWLLPAVPPEVKYRTREIGQHDYWYLRRMLVADSGTGFANGEIYEKRQDLKRALFRRSPEGLIEFERAIQAKSDQQFQSFLRHALMSMNQPGVVRSIRRA